MNQVVQYLVNIATIGVIYSVLALGLNVRYGWTGNLDLSFYAFAALGAYIEAVLSLPPENLPPPDAYILGLSLPWPVAVVGAMVVCGVLSLLLGAVALRSLRGDYFAILTIVTTLIVYATISQLTPLFNGYTGLFAIPQPLDSVFSIDTYPIAFLVIVVLVLAATYAVVQLLYKSPFGRAVRSTREDDIAAAAFGRNVFRLKLKTFVISGMVAGLGGALLGTWLTAWNPTAWSPIEVLLLYAAVFVGGTGNSKGAIFGAFFIFVAIQEVTRFIPTFSIDQTSIASLRNVIIGLLIAAVLWFRPQGVLPESRARFGKRFARQPTPSAQPEDARVAV